MVVEQESMPSTQMTPARSFRDDMSNFQHASPLHAESIRYCRDERDCGRGFPFRCCVASPGRCRGWFRA
jgi:hypothetical protein